MNGYFSAVFKYSYFSEYSHLVPTYRCHPDVLRKKMLQKFTGKKPWWGKVTGLSLALLK